MVYERNVAQQLAIAETGYGKVRGAEVRGVHIFRGIPYGGPTQGAGRFLPPTKPAPWAGIRDATVTGPRCIQSPGCLFLNPDIGPYFSGGRPDTAELVQQEDSEDCLNLNVLTPGLTGKRPVLVYIHGGGFSGGSSVLTLLSDAFPREQNVVLVGVNHRLNVFGYTYLGAFSARYALGNPGQLDLVAALEWVRDNIAAFGGDPDNVTIFGESGGGAKISTLMAMPAAQGLFRRAIVESGSLLYVDTADEATATARALLARLGLRESQVDELQRIPAAQLYAASCGDPTSPEDMMRFGPVIDGRSVPQQTWEPHAPTISAHVPMLIGNCKDESTLFTMGDRELFALDDAGLRARLAKAGIPEAEVDPLLAAYHRDHPAESPTDLYFRISTDRGARRNAVRQAELQLGLGQANVFVYYFAWNTPCADGQIRAFHTAELPLAMRLVCHPEAEQLSRQISAAWAAFARCGDPNHEDLPHWPAYDTAQRATMIFDAAQSAVANDPDSDERCLLLDRPSGSLL